MNIAVKIGQLKIIKKVLVSLLILSILPNISFAGPREQAKRIHDRLAGVPPSNQVLDQMEASIIAGNVEAAAYIAMDNSAFYSVTLKNWVTPWTNEEADVFAPLNDYTATVIGIVRDDIDFREILSGNILYIGNEQQNVPAYGIDDNNHYQALEDQEADLQAALERTTQTAVTGLPEQATAGVMTTRAAAKSFFKDGTNRAMFRFTLMNHLCTDLEGVKDTSRVPDRIRQDVSRSPGGDSRIFINSCIGCHSGMDPLAQSFAYYNYAYDTNADPDGVNGRLQYNQAGQNDPVTGTQVQEKYLINGNNFPFGYVTPDDSWENYWRAGLNKNLGWDETLPSKGNGAKSMGRELANSQRFSQCQVTKVFQNVCLREPENESDRTEIDNMVSRFQSNNYQIKQVFSDAANYCKGS